jgi:hypothetical protein
MRHTFRLIVIPFILGTILVAGVWLRAQTIQPQAPTIISGPDLGFRIDSRKAKLPMRRALGEILLKPSPGAIPRRELLFGHSVC